MNLIPNGKGFLSIVCKCVFVYGIYMSKCKCMRLTVKVTTHVIEINQEEHVCRISLARVIFFRLENLNGQQSTNKPCVILALGTLLLIILNSVDGSVVLLC